MKSFLAFFFLCFCLSVATAQTTTKKKTTTAKKSVTTKSTATPAKTPTSTTTAAKKTATTKPVAVTTGPSASTLTFPSTEPENAAAMDAAQKQQMYDELHGVKNRPNTPDTGRKGRRSPDEMATRADRRAVESTGTEARTYIGVRAGGNYSTYLEKLRVANGTGGFIDLTPDPMFGFHAGVVFQFGNGAVAFQPEINFQQDYYKVVTLTSTSRITTTESLNSLVVPLLAKFQFGQQGNTRFFVNVGPYGAYSLESRPSNSETVIGYGGALGLGVGIPAGSGKITVEARGYYSLGSTATGSEFGNVPGKPILGQLSLGYLFPLGSR